MAPALLETPETTSLRRTADSKPAGLYNKELANGLAFAYDSKNELEGTEKEPPASFPNYLPVWDNETER